MGKWLFTDKNGNEIMPLGVQAHNSSTGSGVDPEGTAHTEAFWRKHPGSAGILESDGEGRGKL